jgi:hypothetical protein
MRYFLIIWAVVMAAIIGSRIWKSGSKATSGTGSDPIDEARVAEGTQRFVSRIRMLGWGFLLGGSIMSIGMIYTSFDPTQKITINGIPTYDFHAKLGVAAFTCIFPILGAFLAFTPRTLLEALFRRYLEESLRQISRLRRSLPFGRRDR